MITLYQFTPTWGIPNLGQFNVKIETYLRMAKLPYKAINTMPLTGPKGKLPFIEDQGQKISDSSFIIEYLKNQYGDTLDNELSTDQQAIVVAMQRLFEEHLYWVGMYTRWNYTDENWKTIKKATFGDMPPVIRDLVAMIYKQFIIRKQIYGHGMGRHSSNEIFHLAEIDIDAVSTFLADKPFFMGDKPTSLDATAFGILINTLRGPIESPIKDYALTKNNLSAYCDRMMASFYPELNTET